MKTLLYNILIIIGSTFFFSIGVGFAQPDNDQDTLQSRMEKLEKENEEKTIKIKRLEDQLTLQKYAIDHFDMILTKETLFFAGIISVGLLLAGLISFGGFLYEVNKIKGDIKSELTIINSKIESQIKKSEDSLFDTQIFSESQWGNLAIVLARTEKGNPSQIIYYLLKACSHYSDEDTLRVKFGKKAENSDLIISNLDITKAEIEEAQNTGYSLKEILGEIKEKDWEKVFNIISSYDDSEVRNKIANIRTLIFS